MGSLCLRSLWMGNSFVGDPFTRTEAVAVPTHSDIHFRHKVGKFIWLITTSRYFKSTESCAFSKSTLNINISFFIRLASSTTSFAIRMPYKICFPWIKADWDSDTTLPITARSLFARTLANTLYRNPTKDMGWKSLRFWGLSTFGIKAINVEFTPVVSFSLRCNSDKNIIKSSFNSDQNSLMKPKLIPSGPRLLKLSQSQTVCFTSSSEKGRTKLVASQPANFRKSWPSTPGLSPPSCLGNGFNTFYWSDCWVETVTFRERFMFNWILKR